MTAKKQAPKPLTRKEKDAIEERIAKEGGTEATIYKAGPDADAFLKGIKVPAGVEMPKPTAKATKGKGK